MPGSYISFYYHLIFSTKNRRPWLREDIRPRVWEYLGGLLRNHGGSPLIIGGVSDHVHLLATLRQDRAVADVVRDVKCNSSAWIHREFLDLRDFAWQEGYGGFTLHSQLLDRAVAYIKGQEEHHRTVTFEEEFVRFLDRHGVKYDARYIWR